MKNKFLFQSEIYTIQTFVNDGLFNSKIIPNSDDHEIIQSRMEFINDHSFLLKSSQNTTIKGFFFVKDDKIEISLGGKNFVIKNQFAKGTASSASSDYFSPMPGKVLKILVQNDEIVEEGQSLLVIEAMKIENQIKARSSGKVSSLDCKVGEIVDPEKVLLTIV